MFGSLGQILILEGEGHKRQNLNPQTHLLEERKLLFVDQKNLQVVES